MTIVEGKSGETRVAEDGSGLIVNKNRITTKADEKKADDDPDDGDKKLPQGDHRTSSHSFSRRPLSSYERHGRYVPVYTVKLAGQVVDLETSERMADLLARGHYAVHAYVAKSLHAVAAAGCAWDMPDTLLARFVGDEYPAPVRECFLLTLDLYETILEKCGAAEAAFAAGGMEDVNYRIMCHRMRAEHGVEAMARRYAAARDFSRSL